MIDAVEESVEEQVVLLLVRVLHRVGHLKCLHELAEVLFVDFAILGGELLQVVVQRLAKALLSKFIIVIKVRPLEEVCYKLGYIGHLQVIVRFKMED